jgi:hypothetical protein
MASQHESLRDPFIIIFSVPTAAIGAVRRSSHRHGVQRLKLHRHCIGAGRHRRQRRHLLVDCTNISAAATGLPAVELAGAPLRPILTLNRPRSVLCRCRPDSAKVLSPGTLAAWSSAAAPLLIRWFPVPPPTRFSEGLWALFKSKGRWLTLRRMEKGAADTTERSYRGGGAIQIREAEKPRRNHQRRYARRRRRHRRRDGDAQAATTVQVEAGVRIQALWDTTLCKGLVLPDSSVAL